MSAAKIAVFKFGSSVLRSEQDLPRAVQEIYRLWRAGEQVVVVVSALGDTTDQLLSRATSICDRPNEVVLATLLATGETTASALLALALQRAGIPVKVFDAVQAGLQTTGSVIDAKLIALDTERLRSELKHFVIVLSGFVGRDDENRTTLLGRGGSDFTCRLRGAQNRGTLRPNQRRRWDLRKRPCEKLQTSGAFSTCNVRNSLPNR
jgi:homoserine dehydrogenase